MLLIFRHWECIEAIVFRIRRRKKKMLFTGTFATELGTKGALHLAAKAHRKAYAVQCHETIRHKATRSTNSPGCVCVVILGCASDGCGEEDPSATVCHWDVPSANERLR